MYVCQKAFGNLFGAHFFALGQFIGWESAEPAYFHSSNIARRGFCREWGTPLSFEYLGSEEIHLTGLAASRSRGACDRWRTTGSRAT